MRSAGSAVLAALLTLPVPAPVSAQDDCAIAPDDRVWLETSLDQWRRSLRDELRVSDQTLPDVYAIDARCLYRLPGGEIAGAIGSVHPDGTVTLPAVGTVPVGPISFAFAADGFATVADAVGADLRNHA